MTSEIPKRIIQTGKSRDLPLADRAALANVTLLNPDFEHRFFTDEDIEVFIDEEFPMHRALFDSFPYRIQKFDFFRYLAVYRLGGFYMDLDVFLATGLSGLVQSGCVFPFEELTTSQYLRQECNMDWEIGNFAFGATAGHPFLKQIIDNCVRAQQDPRWVDSMMKGIPRLFRKEFYVLHTTGPGLISRTLSEHPELAKTVTVLFPEDVCDPESWHQFGDLGVHLMAGTWRTDQSPLLRRLGFRWQAMTRRRMVKESVRKGKTRQLPQ